MLPGENYYSPWAEAERFPEFSCPVPGPGPCSPEGGGGDRHWAGADGVSEGTHLLGVAKLEYVSGRVSELLPSIQE